MFFIFDGAWWAHKFVYLALLHLYNLSSILEGKYLNCYSIISAPQRLKLLAKAKVFKREVQKRKEKLEGFLEKI